MRYRLCDSNRLLGVLAPPWNLQIELTKQLAYITDWADELVFPLSQLHAASLPNSENSRR